jgi:RhtB (resistance to homoserine/threonine) family protein
VITNLWAFLGVAVLIIAAPGPDTVVVTKNAIFHGPRTALATSFGVNSGLLVWTAGAALGLDALIRASAVAFDVLKVAGAVYLIWLGVGALRHAGRITAAAESSGSGDAAASRSAGAARGYRQGLFSNLANPKVAVFFTSLLPQVVAGRTSALPAFLLLGSLFVAINLVWLGGYAVIASRISSVLMRRRVKRAMDRVTGIVLIGFGIRLALERR